MKPRGYLYSIDTTAPGCTIGVQGISDSLNQYRLGTIFLRNFYVVLNFKDNMLLIGLNKNTNDAEIVGASRDPHRNSQKDRQRSGHTAFFVIFFITLAIIIAGLCYYRAKRNEQARTITFKVPKPLLSEEGQTVRRYKDGVEIKPSEYLKMKEEDKNKESLTSIKSTAINESASQDEHLDSEEF